MQITIHYDVAEIYSPDDIQLLGQLSLDMKDLTDHVLTHWVIYRHGDISEMYETLVDALYEHIHHKYGDTDQGIHAHQLLANGADQLVQMTDMLAQYLARMLVNMPDEISRGRMTEDHYHFLRVDRISITGRFAVLRTDTIDLYG